LRSKPFLLVTFVTFVAATVTSCRNPSVGPGHSPVETTPLPTVTAKPIAQLGRKSKASLKELRGVWITQADSNVFFSKTSIENSLQQLANLNFTTVYPAIWNEGLSLYPSAFLASIGGEKQSKKFGGAGRDPVAEVFEMGQKYDVTVVPWFEYGLKLPPNSALAQLKKEWLTQSSSGNVVRTNDGFSMVWMNPLMPEVQKFFTDLLIEFVQKYNPIQIQFDDNFSMPKELLYDPYTVQLYKAEKGKNPPTSEKSPDWENWTQWRANKMTDAVGTIFQAVKKASRNKLIISVSPNPAVWALANYLQDWPQWLAKGYCDNAVVQLYRNELPSFIRELDALPLSAVKSKIAVGVLSGLKARPSSMELVRSQLVEIKKRQFAGYVFFFYESLFSLRPQGDTEQGRKSTLQSFQSELSKEPEGF
jgi:uncharacterized lipoprotein YddW (UPF0748 family)